MPTAEEIELAFDQGGTHLVGSLHLPQGTGPHPAVVMSQGSGPADRDSGGYFVPIREAFLGRGIAVFAFDKPGCGRSTGDWREHALGDRADQLVAAVEVTRAQPDVAADRVGIFGHSQGGWVVQQVAGRRVPLAFAICSAAPTISIGEQILYDCEHAMIEHGLAPAAIAEGLEFARALQRAAVDGEDLASVTRRLLEPADRQPWYPFVVRLDDERDWLHLGRFLCEPHDPPSDLRRVACPILAVYGGRDVLLPPWRCTEDFGRAVQAADTDDATAIVLPLGDHRMRRPNTEELVDGYLDLLGSWATARVGDPADRSR